MTQQRHYRGLTLLVVGLLFLTATAFSQGLVWESTTSGGPLGDKAMTAEMYYMPKMFKSVSNDGDNVVIFRLDKEVLYQLNPQQKTYSQMTFAEMEAQMKKMSGQMDARMDELRKKMETMPEEQRKMVEQMMGDKMKPGAKEAKIDITRTSDTRSIAGYNATKYVVTSDGKETMAVWATRELKGFDAMRKDMESFTRRMMAMNPMGTRGLAEALQKVDGFPLETDMNDIKNVVTKIERKNTPPEQFTVPAGYTMTKPAAADEEKAKQD